MRHPIVLDLETKHTFREFARPQELGISIVGIYDYKDGKLKSFLEEELNELFPILENASFTIGYNIDGFDFPALEPYYPGDISQLRTLDILAEIKRAIGRRLSLDVVSSATLGEKKSGTGLQAISLYKKGEIAKLRKYCLDDVSLTRKLFDFGVERGKIFYPDTSGKVLIPVDWKKHLERKSKKDDVSLTLPF